MTKQLSPVACDRKTIGGLLGGCYVRITKTLHVLAALFLCVTALYGRMPGHSGTPLGGQPEWKANSVADQGLPEIPLLMGSITLDTADKALSIGKVEAGVALGLEVSGKYRLVSSFERDSVLRSLKRTSEVTLAEASHILKTNAIVFTNVARIANLIRTEVILTDGLPEGITTSGIGYAVLRHHDNITEKVMADPAILASFQRAFALCIADSTLFANAEGSFRVVPTELVSVGGITFKDLGGGEQWSLFKEKVTVSYDAVQTVAHALQDLDRYTVTDIETRDSMYALAGMFLVENYNSATATELKILRMFEVKDIITGSITKSGNEAVIELSLNRIKENDTVHRLKSASVTLTKDSKVALREALHEALTGLLGPVSAPRPEDR